MRHEAVLEAAVVGKDEGGLTRTLAYVVLKSGTGDDALAETLEGVREGPARAAQVSARDPLHRASCRRPRPGKIQRFKLREAASRDEAADAARQAFAAERPPRRHRVRVDRSGPVAPGRRLPARGPGLALDVEGFSGAALRRARHARPRLLAPRLRPVDAARERRALAGRLHASPGVGGAARVARGAGRAAAARGCSGTATARSIALLYAAAFPDAPAGVVALAPHLFVEDVSVRSIEAHAAAYRSHRPAHAARALSSTIRTPRSSAGTTSGSIPRSARGTSKREMPRIRCPVLAIQGEDDEYGTMAQIDRLAHRRAAGAARQARGSAATRRTATSPIA